MWVSVLVIIAFSVFKAESGIESRCYEMRPIPGKGFGCLATRDIEIGECIMQEPPLIKLASKSSWFSPTESYSVGKLEKDFSNLSAEDQERFSSLHSFGRFGVTAVKILEIYRTNAYPAGPHASAIFPEISRLNSACRPNVHYHFDEARNLATVHAIERIPASSEILNCYISLLMARSARRTYLKQNFGFECGCAACSLEGLSLQQSDFRRQKLLALEKLCRVPMDVSTEQTSLFDLGLKGTECVAELLQMRTSLLEEEGIASAATLFKVARDVFFRTDGERHALEEMVRRSGGRSRTLLERAEDGLRWARQCKGAQSKEVREFGQLLVFLREELARSSQP